MNFNTIFARWSFNSLIISFLVSTSFLVSGIIYIMNLSKNSYGTGGELPLALFLIFYYLCLQIIALVIALVLLLAEINSSFRVKNQFLLKIFSNIFYQIFATIIGILEIFLMVVCTIGFIQLAPHFL